MVFYASLLSFSNTQHRLMRSRTYSSSICICVVRVHDLGDVLLRGFPSWLAFSRSDQLFASLCGECGTHVSCPMGLCGASQWPPTEVYSSMWDRERQFRSTLPLPFIICSLENTYRVMDGLLARDYSYQVIAR